MQWPNVKQVKYPQTKSTAAPNRCAAVETLVNFLTSPLLVTSGLHGFAHGY